MGSPECIFCKIVAGELPATIVDEDERTIAFMDISPATRRHALVIPPAHAPRLPAPAEPREGAAARRRRQPAELLRGRGLADGVPLPRPRDPPLRGRSAAASVAARARGPPGDRGGRAGTRRAVEKAGNR